MSSPTQSVTLTFQDPSGTPIAGGKVTFDLSYDISNATSGGIQVSSGITTSATLDSNGRCTVTLYRTDILVPSGSVYFVRVYTAEGQLVYSEQMTVT
jgi:hypothetical protein